ncbi:MAG: hypothetical protein QF903_14325 [Planctomycetota bacterium]|jgi:hypothetical protein|nr:hypothetical protein [Planctomycetota bacterium]MDP6761552.1 hypothetical protein [Planctomycetota bacterium]MDP6990644.1 hypothetical protein [Planctomycetota bacterium]
MNVSQVKGASWLTAAGLTGLLGWYVFAFVGGLDGLRSLFPENARDVLTDVDQAEEVEIDLVSAKSVERAFYDLNWTGAPPPPPPPEPEAPEPEKPRHVPVASLVKVLFTLHDERRPERSTVFLSYLPAAGVEEVDAGLGTTGVGGVSLTVGDRLAAPHGHVIVHAITSVGVTFAFDDAEREHEVLNVRAFDPQSVIVKTTEDGAVALPRVHIPTISSRAAWSFQKRTSLVAKDHYALGLEDQLDFEEDFAGILAREVRHRRHRDPRTGRYDGIELIEVEPGGVAARHGAQSGDIIKSINDHPVASSSEAINFVKNNQDKYSTWVVVIENRGKERVVTYDTPPQQ